MEKLTNNEIDNIQNKIEINVKSGSKNKSINNYVKKICKKILEKSSLIELNAYGKLFILKKDNNINKLITILEIIKRSLPELKYEYNVYWHLKENVIEKGMDNKSKEKAKQGNDLYLIKFF